MMKRFLTYFLISISFIGNTQSRFQLYFEDKKTGAVLDSVNVTIAVDLNLHHTHKQNIYAGYVDNGDSLTLENLEAPPYLAFSLKKEGYFNKDTILLMSTFTKEVKKEKLITLHFALNYKGQYVDEFDLLSHYEPPITFSSERVSVADYEILSKDTILILAYPKRIEVSSELLWVINGSIEKQKMMPEGIISLEKDYRHRIYAVGKEKAFMIKDIPSLQLIEVDKKQLDNSVKPVLDTLEERQLFYTTYKEYYPAFDFFRIMLEDTSNYLLYHIEDKEMMEHYRAEFKYVDVRTKLWAWEMQGESGIDKEVWVGANVYSKSIFYEAPYGNFFLKNDTAYVFDFYKDYLYRFQAETGEVIDSLIMNFHYDAKKTGWKKQLIQDPVSKHIYTCFHKGGDSFIEEINLSTGKLNNNKFQLFYRYPENVKVFDGKVFYIYRPFESIQKKYLYGESLEDNRKGFAGRDIYRNVIWKTK